MERVKANQKHISSVSSHTFSNQLYYPLNNNNVSRYCILTVVLKQLSFAPPAAVLLGLQADERPDVVSHRDTGDYTSQRECQEDQRCMFTCTYAHTCIKMLRK